MFWIRHSCSCIKAHSRRLALSALAVVVAACGGGGSSPTAPGGAPPPPITTAQIAVMGCSQSTNAWRGWLAQGDGRVWTQVVGYNGGTVTRWASQIPDGDYWRRLRTNMGSNPTANVVWWQLCDVIRTPGSIMGVEAIFNEIQNQLPRATIYVTPLAEFQAPETCLKQNISNSRLLADHLVMSGLAQRGPELPLVLSTWIEDGDHGCHVGRIGEAEFGMTLAGFDWLVLQ